MPSSAVPSSAVPSNAVPPNAVPSNAVPPSGDQAPAVGFDPYLDALERARAALDEGRADEALIALNAAAEEVVGAPPAEVQVARALALAQLGRDEQALAAARAPTGPNLVADLEAARALVRLQRAPEGEAALDVLLQRYPNFGPARVARASLRARDGRHGDAAADFARILEQAPDQAFAAAEYARTRFELGERATSLAGLELWIATHGDDPQFTARAMWIELLLADGQTAAAHGAAKTVIHPSGAERPLLLAIEASLAAGEPLDALRAAVHALESAPSSVLALDALAPLVADHPKLQIALARERLARAPAAENHGRLVQVLLSAGQPGAALAHLQGLAPEQRMSTGRVEAQVLRRLGRHDEARARLAEVGPGDFEAAYELGLLEAELGRLDPALAAFERAATKGGALAADAHESRAVLFERAGRFADAAKALDAALVADPTRPEAWLRLAQIARTRMGDRARASAAYTRFFNLGGEDADGWAYLDSTRPRAAGSRP